MPRLLRQAVTAAGTAALVAIALIGFHVMAARIVAAHLLHEAQRQAAALQAGQPLWQWSLRKPGDLVAGRAFGHASLATDGDSLRVTSIDGTPFELGLPIDRAVDLVGWPLLHLQLDHSADGSLELIRQSAPGANACTSAAVALSSLRDQPQLDLNKLPWTSASGSPCATGEPAWMLRLRIQLPAGGSVRLHTAALLRANAPVLPTAPTLSLRPAEEIGSAIARAPLAQDIDWIALPPAASAETMLAARDRLRAHWPAALIVPAGKNPLAAAAAKSRQGWARLVCALYLSLLFSLTLWRPQGIGHPWLEIAACLAGPLWLVAGLQWGPGRLALPAVSAALGALVYAIIMEWRQRPRSWSTSGPVGSWLWPLLPMLIALGMLLGYGQARHLPLPSHGLIYLVWAGLQQWLMLAVTLPRLQQGLSRLPEPARTALACLITAVLFALLHTPNGALMQLCLLAEFWWAWCFTRSRNLPSIVLAHACCGLLVESGLFGVLLRSLEVSARFFL